MISLQNVSKSFGSTKAVDDLTFTVEKGEIVGFLGPNGAGKTTTMRMMTGYITPDSGTIAVDGVSLLTNPIEIQSSIGYLPENNPLYKDMLVNEQLDFSSQLKGLSGTEKSEAIDFAVTSVSIEDVYYRPIKELSKGYKQRVGIAMALLKKPKILIMDEPSEGLDPNQRTEIRSLIKTLAQDHTIIMSTHVMQEAEAVCNRMLIITKGKIIADGTSKELIRKVTGGDRNLSLEIEGKEIERGIRSIKGIENAQFKKGRDGKMSITLKVSKGKKIQPEISSLASKHKWIIWKLTEEEQQMEDVFHVITNINTL